MSEHEWCSDTARDEAVRAAEDAAAVPAIQHRDLPEIVAALRARVARLEHRFAAASEIVAPPQPDPASPAEGMRTERVTLEVTHDCLYPAAEWVLEAVQERFEGPTESVRVVEQTETMRCMTKLRRERDAARADAERLRDRVAELEAASAVPSRPRGWLTAEERAWLENEASRISNHLDEVAAMHTVGSTIRPQQMRKDVALLRALLARESPPRVMRPPFLAVETWHSRDQRWIAAIRAAGGEVEG